MTPLSIWLRRGVGKYLALVLFGFVLASLLTQSDWHLEYDWATRLTAADVIIACPCLAAAAAFDTARRFRPSLWTLSQGSTRRAGQVIPPAAAIVIWSAFAYLLVWVTAFAIVAYRGGVGVTDWWVFPEVAAPLAAAGAIGLWVGMAVANQFAAPLAAVATLALTIAASPWGRGPFEAVTTYGTLDGVGAFLKSGHRVNCWCPARWERRCAHGRDAEQPAQASARFHTRLAHRGHRGG